MWRHNLSHHGGKIINYKTDFKYKLLNNHKHLISKHCSEGWRQSTMEELQQKGRVNVCNSKLDFTRPFMKHLTMQSGSLNTGTGMQQPHSSRQFHRSRQMPDKHKQPSRIIPLKTKSKTVRISTGPFRNFSGPSGNKTGPFRNSVKFKNNKSNSYQTSDSSDNQEDQNPDKRRQINHTDNSQSILISGSNNQENSVKQSSAQPSRAAKRRSSTPVHQINIKKVKFNDLIGLSPIKEPSE